MNIDEQYWAYRGREMNRVTTSATLFLAAIMLAVGTAVAFPTVKYVVSSPAESAQSKTTEVETTEVSAVTDTGIAPKNDSLLAALADEQTSLSVPLIAVPVVKSAKPQSLYWAMKFVLGSGDAGIEQLPPIGDGSVKLIRKGEVVGSYSIGPGGIAQVPQLSSGVYSIVVRSVDGFAAIGAYLVGGSEKGEITVNLALVPIQESAVVDSLLARARENKSNSAGIQKEFHYDENTLLVSRQDVVGRGADGVVRIRLLELLDQYGLAQTTQGLSVHFVLNEKIVSHGITDEDGIAEFQGVDNGRYAMIVTGQQRVIVISVLVKDRIGKVQEVESAISFITNLVIGSAPVSMNQAVSVAAAGTTPPDDFNTVNQSMNVGSGGPGAPGGVGGSPFGGGGAGGSGGGGSGAGGGGGVGGGGGLLGAAAAGAAGFLAGNNNNDNGVASP